MAAPAFKIPVEVDLQSLKQQMDAGANHVGQAARFMGQQFEKLNGAIVAGGGSAAAAYASGFAGAALRIAGGFALVLGIFKLIGSAIDITREQLEKMVAIADKAKTALVTPRFFQAFTAEADKLQVGVSELEAALTAAFNATKDKAPIDTDAWTTGEEKITAVEKALRVYNETFFRTQGQALSGLVLFRDADTQEKKIQAVLEAMVQLEAVGQRAAALDVGEKMFGSAFVDRIRQGRTSAEEMLATIKASAEASSGVFTNETISRAKQIDDELKKAHQTLEKNLKPTWDGLANIMLSVKSLWADVVGLMARAAALGPAVADVSLATQRKQIDELKSQLAALPRGGLVGADGGPRARDLAAQIAALEERARQTQEDLRDAGITQANAGGSPTSRGVGDAPKPPPPKEEPRDRVDIFDRAIENAEKRTAVLEAETAAIDQGTAARERAKLVAELEAAAVQANSRAGLENTAVTAAQREEIDRVAASYEKAAQKAEEANAPLRRFAREAADVSKQLQEAGVSGLRSFEDGLIGIVKGTKSAADAFKDMANSIIEDLIRIAIRAQITGPIAAFLGFSSGGVVGGGGARGFFGFSEGGPVRAADGGTFRGPGTGTSDSIPALVSNGEYIVRATQAARHRDLLDAINSGQIDRAPVSEVTSGTSARTIVLQAHPRSEQSVRDLMHDLVRVSEDMPVKLKLA